MAYSTPPNFATGAVLTEANLDTLSNDITFLANPPKVRVYNSSNISIATSGTAQALTFDSERYDTDTMHSTSSNTGRLTATTAGTYSAGAGVRFASNATGYRQLYLERFNSAGVSQGTYGSLTVGANPADVTDLVIGGVDIAMSAGDYLTVSVKQTSGGALNVSAVAALSPEAWMRWVSL